MVRAGGVLFDLCWARASHQTPGLAIFFKQRLALAVGIEAQSLARCEGLDGHDVPQVFENNPGDQEINLVASVGGLPSRAAFTR